MIEISKSDLEHLIFDEKLPYTEIGHRLGCSSSYVKKYALKLGIELQPKRKINECETFNKGVSKYTHKCINCGKPVKTLQSKFCSATCCHSYKRNQLYEDWKTGKFSGNDSRGFLSEWIRNALISDKHYKCEICGWDKINPATGKCPVQVHHIDGNLSNNRPENLQVLCPNCHSLTENFGALNKSKEYDHSLQKIKKDIKSRCNR